MVAHLDSVTSLAVDQHGLYLISGSHDCSIRCVYLKKFGLTNVEMNNIMNQNEKIVIIYSVHVYYVAPKRKMFYLLST